uniref:Uncharacterized protein n=1 Tax=Oryza meridionalis TaxID=40149 RepID=A0A0E0EBT7_9ORYZ
MELYAAAMTTATGSSSIFLGGPRSPRRADSNKIVLKRMATNGWEQTDPAERKWEGETTTAKWFARRRDANVAEAQGQYTWIQRSDLAKEEAVAFMAGSYLA